MMRFLFLLLASLAPALGAQEAELLSVAAPRNRWYCQGGSGSRSGLSLAKSSAGQLVEDWIYRSPARFLVPSLVWDQHLVVLEEMPKARAIIKVLDIDNGAILMKSADFPCAKASKMSIWGRTIAIQTDAQEIRFWRIGYTRISRGQRLVLPGIVQDFLVHKGSIYITAGDDLLARTLGHSKNRWRITGGFRGQLAIVNRDVFVVDYSRWSAELKVFDAVSGKQISQVETGIRCPTPKPGIDFCGAIQVGQKLVAVRLASPFSSRLSDEKANTVFFAKHGSGKTMSLAKSTEVKMTGTAVLHGRTALFRGGIRAARDGIILYDERRSVFREMISASDRADLLTKKKTACILCRNVIWVNDCAFRVNDLRMLRQGGDRDFDSAIPVKGGMLFTANDHHELRVMRDPSYWSNRSSRRFGPPKGLVDSGRAVLRNGKTIEGQIEFDVAKKRLTKIRRNGKKKEYDLDQLLVLEDDKSNVVMAPNDSLLLLGLTRLDYLDLAKLYEKVVIESLKSNDATLTDFYLRRASAYGADEKNIAKFRKRLTTLRKRRKILLKPKLVTKAKAREKAGLKMIRERVWTRIKNFPADTPKSLQVQLLTVLLRDLPGHKEAAELVNSWLPKEVQGKGQLSNPAAWLDFVVAASQTKIKIINPPKADAKATSWDEGLVGATQHTWRKDILGVRSKRLLVLTPLKNPSQVVRCLALGETVCDALEETFSDGTRKRSKWRPLVIHLFPTRKDYIAYGKSRGMRQIANTLGFYNQQQNITRLYLPDSPEEIEALLGTFVHELTHHWTFERCPLFSTRDAARSIFGNRGVWVVEGFADMVSDYIFDPEMRTFNRDNPRARSLDVVANAADKQLIDWGTLLNMSHAHLLELSGEPRPDLQVKLHWMVGLTVNQSPVNVFYSQSAALCHFLMRGEGGKYRKELLKFVAEFYQGKSRSWSAEKALGMSPEELGRKVRAFARAESRREPRPKSKEMK